MRCLSLGVSRRIGLDIRQLILERNALDFAMYTIVKQRFMQRCGHVRPSSLHVPTTWPWRLRG